MTILHYIPSINKKDGGTTAYMQLLSKALGELTSLHVVTHQSTNDVEIVGATVHYISSSLRGAMKNEWFELLDSLLPNVVHINCCWLPSCALLQKWAKKKGYPTILTPHGMLEPWIMKRNFWTRKLPALFLFQKNAIKRADFIHATAESERDNLLKLGYNKKIDIIPNGIDLEEIALKKVWRKAQNLLFLSRVHQKKGIEVLLKALNELKEENDNFHLTIVGEGEAEYVEQIKALIDNLDLVEKVTFRGGVYGEDKWRQFEQADIFVLPTYSENFGIVVAEALATGTPVITTTGTPWQVLEEYNCGWWVNATPIDIKRAVQSSLKLNEKSLEEMGRNGRKLTEEKFSIHALAVNFINLYNKVLVNYNLCQK